MKKISILLLITLITTTASAQMRSANDIGKLKINWYKTGWFLDANAGGRFLGQTSSFADMGLGPSFNAGIGYFFNDKIAIKGRLDYNQFYADYGEATTYNSNFGTPGSGDNIDRSGSVAASAEVMFRLLQVFNPKRSRNFSLNFHVGAGLTTFRNPSYINARESEGVVFDDPFIKGHDDMGHIIVGLTPQYHINSRWSINLDVSQFTQFKQYNTYDTHNEIKSKDVTGLLSTTIGLTFRP